jgi:hypothetical protein
MNRNVRRAVCGLAVCFALMSAVFSNGTEKLNQGGSAWVHVTDSRFNVKTTGGDITLYAPDGYAATAETRIDETKDLHWIQSDFPAEIDYRNGKAILSLVLAGAGDTIRLRTREGDIYIRKLE